MSFGAASDSSLPISRTLYHPPFNPSPPSPRVPRLQCHAGSAPAESFDTGALWLSGRDLELPGHRAASEPRSVHCHQRKANDPPLGATTDKSSGESLSRY